MLNYSTCDFDRVAKRIIINGYKRNMCHVVEVRQRYKNLAAKIINVFVAVSTFNGLQLI